MYPEAGKREGLEDGKARELFDEIGASEHAVVVVAGRSYAEHVSAQGTEPRFVKQLPNFLRDGFWRNYARALPLGRDGPHGKSAVELDLEAAGAMNAEARKNGTYRVPERPKGL